MNKRIQYNVLTFNEMVLPMKPRTNDTSGQVGEQVSLLMWVGRNLRAYSMPCFLKSIIYLSTMWISLNDVVEYFTMSHAWFILKSTMVYWLWTWVWPRKPMKSLMLLDNNYNLFKNVQIGGNCKIEKYLMKINFSKYIKYLTNMCWNGWGIIHQYTSLYND
jgi:hypothetical protein